MLLTSLTKTNVKKNLTTSVIRAGLGQLIHLGTTPILSRIYTPNAFGNFSLFISLLGVFSAFSLMKLDLGVITGDKLGPGQIKRILSTLTFITTLTIALTTIILGFKIILIS